MPFSSQEKNDSSHLWIWRACNYCVQWSVKDLPFAWTSLKDCRFTAMISWNPNLSCIKQNGEIKCPVESNLEAMSNKVLSRDMREETSMEIDCSFSNTPVYDTQIRHKLSSQAFSDFLSTKWWPHVFKPIDCATAIVNPEANHELCVPMMCQHGFINSTNVPSLMGEFDKGGSCACVEAQGMCICEQCVLLLFNSAVNPKLCKK